MTDDLVYRLREKYDSDWDEYDELSQEAAACIEAQDKRNKELEAALRKIANKNEVKAGTDAEMYKRWRKVATDGIDVARAALGEKKDA